MIKFPLFSVAFPSIHGLYPYKAITMSGNAFKILLLGLSFISITACYKDKEDVSEVIIKDKPRIIIESANIISKIVDENGEALEGITAKFGERIKVVTSSNYFYFSGQKINKYFEVLEVTDKEGAKYHFNLPVIENEVCYFNPVLFKNSIKKPSLSNEATSVSISSSINIDIPANSYLKSNLPYQGELLLKYHHYDMTKTLHRQALPGGLIAQNGNHESVMLLIQDAFSIVATSPDEQVLQFTNECKLHYSDDHNDLYYYNEEIQSWEYVTSLKTSPTIAKSGTYCIAASSKYHSIKGRLLSKDVPNPNVAVDLNYNGRTHRTYTTNSGAWETIAPDNMDVAMSYMLNCSQIKRILPSNDKDTEYTPDRIDDNMGLTHFKGKVVDCSGQSVNNAFIKIKSSHEEKIIYLKNGIIDLQFPHCMVEKLIVKCINEDFTDSSNEVEWASGNTRNIYSSYACNQNNVNYAILKNVNSSKVYNSGVSSFSDGKITVEYSEPSTKASFRLTFRGAGEGVIDPSLVNINWIDETFDNVGYSIYCPTSNDCGFEYMEITQFAKEKGGLIRGYFRGNFWLKTFHPLTASNKPIEGEFQLVRNF